MSEIGSEDFPHQFFITEVQPDLRLPPLQILTFPKTETVGEAQLIQAVSYTGWYLTRIARTAHIYVGRAAPTNDSTGEAAIIEVLAEALRPWSEDYALVQQVSRVIVAKSLLPTINSPLKGETIKSLASGATASGVLALTAHNPLLFIPVYFLLIGGTPIIVGVGRGIGAGLEIGLRDMILKLMKSKMPEPPLTQPSAGRRGKPAQ